MNCQLCKKQMYSYHDGELAAQLMLDIERHLAQCSSCRFQYDLTRLENEMLRDNSDIPELSIDFNQRVLHAINLNAISPFEDYQPIAMGKTRRWQWLPIYTKAAVAVVLLALCIYIPGIKYGTRNEDIIPKTPQQLKTAPIAVAMKEALSDTSTNRMSSNNATGALSDPATDKIISQKTAAGALADTITNDKSLKMAQDESSGTVKLNLPMGQKDTVTWNLDSSTYQSIEGGYHWVAGDVGRASRTAGAASLSTDVNWSIGNIPVKYQLQNTIPINAKQTEYNYLSSNKTDKLTVKIIAVTAQSESIIVGSVGVSNSAPPPGLAAAQAEQPADSVSREMQVGNDKLKVVLSGNLNTEELNNIADNLVINKKP